MTIDRIWFVFIWWPQAEATNPMSWLCLTFHAWAIRVLVSIDHVSLWSIMHSSYRSLSIIHIYHSSLINYICAKVVDAQKVVESHVFLYTKDRGWSYKPVELSLFNFCMPADQSMNFNRSCIIIIDHVTRSHIMIHEHTSCYMVAHTDTQGVAHTKT